MKRTFHILRLGLSGIIASMIFVGCSSEKPDGDGKQIESTQALASISPVPEPAIAKDTSAAIGAMNSNIQTSQDQIQRDHESAEKEKDRKHEAEQKELDRKSEMAIVDKKIKSKEKNKLLDAVVGVAYIQGMVNMARPDECGNNSIISGLKDAAKALKEAISTTDDAEEKVSNEKKSEKAEKNTAAHYPDDFVGPIPQLSSETKVAGTDKPQSNEIVYGPPVPENLKELLRVDTKT